MRSPWAEGGLTLHGWVYDIEGGAVCGLDEAGGAPVPLDQVPLDRAATGVGRAR